MDKKTENKEDKRIKLKAELHSLRYRKDCLEDKIREKERELKLLDNILVLY